MGFGTLSRWTVQTMVNSHKDADAGDAIDRHPVTGSEIQPLGINIPDSKLPLELSPTALTVTLYKRRRYLKQLEYCQSYPIQSALRTMFCWDPGG